LEQPTITPATLFAEVTAISTFIPWLSPLLMVKKFFCLFIEFSITSADV
jgi:hypothetical protein